MLLPGTFDLYKSCWDGRLQELTVCAPCRLEERRKVKGLAYYERKKAARKQLADAQSSANVDDKTKEQLEQYGY